VSEPSESLREPSESRQRAVSETFETPASHVRAERLASQRAVRERVRESASRASETGVSPGGE
jgi:hypothetical protein